MSSNIKLISLGSDPEVFLIDKVSKKYIPAIGLIPGDKYNPFPVSDKGHAIQVDNVTAEISIPPSISPKELFDDIKFSLREVEKRIPKNLKISITASAEFDEEHLQDPIAKEFGCQPDFDAYTRMQNLKPDSSGNFRSCGGHIHVGFTEPTEEKCLKLVRILDLFLGVPSVILDKDTKRRSLYGKAGAFRFKDFGIEYRVLSNFWITSQKLVNWVYDNIVEATEFLNNNEILQDDDISRIINCINSSNIPEAKKLCKKYHINYKT